MKNLTAQEYPRFIYHNSRMVALLFVLVFLDRPVTVKELTQIVESDHETVTSELRLLYEWGYAMRSPRSGWFVTDSGRLLIRGVNAVKPRQLEPTTTTLNRRDERDSAAVVEESSELTRYNRVNSDLVAELFFWGVGPPTSWELSKLEYCSISYIRALAKDLQDRNRFEPALLIHRIRSHDKIDFELTEEEQRTKYKEWLDL